MLPKVATNLLHSTVTRSAAAAVQNHTNFRNVLKPGSASTSGASSSNQGPGLFTPSSERPTVRSSPSTLAASASKANAHGGSHGPGSGGAKKDKAGRRFYTGYNGAARAVTQANNLTNQDASNQHEEEELTAVSRRTLLKKAAATPKRTRIRSSSVSSLSFGNKGKERAVVVETGNVLKTVQLHARSLHALTGTGETSATTSEVVEDLEVAPPAPAAVEAKSETPASPRPRRNSISSPVSSPKLDAAQVPLPPSPQLPKSSPHTPSRPYLTWHGEQIAVAKDSEDPEALKRAVKALFDAPADSGLKTADFNLALEAIADTRKSLDPLDLVLQVYNELLARDLRPNMFTYTVLIRLFTERDWEVQRLIASVDSSQNNMLDVEALRAEPNFSSAMKLFEAIVAGDGNNRMPLSLYKSLLRSAASHADVTSALHILSYYERRNIQAEPDLFKHLIQAYSNAGDYKGAELVFSKYRAKEAKGELFSNANVDKGRLYVWNQMIETYFKSNEPVKALGLLDEMLAASAPKGPSATPAGEAEAADVQTSNDAVIPQATGGTYTTIIGGFIHIGDLPSALIWFDKLLEQTAEPGTDDHVPVNNGRPMRPTQAAWTLLLSALAKEKQVDELNAYFRKLVELSSPRRTSVPRVMYEYRYIVTDANLKSLSNVSKAVAMQRLDFVRESVFFAKGDRNWQPFTKVAQVIDAYLLLGAPEKAAQTLKQVVDTRSGSASSDESLRRSIVDLVARYAGSIHMALDASPKLSWSFQSAASLAALVSETLSLTIAPAQAGWLLHAYGKDKAAGLIDATSISPEMWRILLSSAVYCEQDPTAIRIPDYAFQGLASLVSDLAANNVAFDDDLCDVNSRAAIVGLIQGRNGVDYTKSLFEGLGGAYAQTYADLYATAQSNAASQESGSVAESISTPPTTPEFQRSVSPVARTAKPLGVNLQASKDIDMLLKNHDTSLEDKANAAYAIFRRSVDSYKMAPHNATIGRLIQVCGRLKQLDRVFDLYAVASARLSINGKKNRTAAADGREWAQLEDSMIIGLAHAGDVDAAHAHRTRLLNLNQVLGIQKTLAPTADAYGALILHMKDTTDDATGALMLWHEARALGVKPNVYMFNNIISKLARARKADAALELFREMKAEGVKPTSITYGAMIGACARVGDEQSAQALFKEMSEQPNFKARVPPFNMMMQLYTTTKPNRDRALWYYQEMVRAGVKPTAHTYKVLLDVYGSLEPVDIGAMEEVFRELKAQPEKLNNTHFASLLNAYGCVTKQLGTAIEIFHTIPQHGIARDAVAYEALVNALIANKRTDLIDEYMQKMAEDQVHMTAYVANFLIKGYANHGDLEKARAVFEAMVDPPVGVAAPNNHAPHDPSAVVNVPVEEPVYREPSTWEAMIRAELGAGDRERALALLERLGARGYPEAVFQRISGVLVDHTAVPLLAQL